MPLEGLIILLVEDEPLIALDIAQTLRGAGADVRGPLPSLAAAHRYMDAPPGDIRVDAVVLDYQLVDGNTEALARSLTASAIPFVWHTANSELVRPLAEEMKIKVVSKPAAERDLLDALGAVVR